MMCYVSNYGKVEKESDLLNGNRLINLNNLMTNID